MAELPSETEREVFTELYGKYYQEFYRYAFYFTGRAEDAEDAVSDSLVAAYTAFGDLRDQAKFKYWFLKILQNVCKKQLRKRPNTLSIETQYEDGIDLPDPSAGDFEDNVVLRQILTTLKPEDRSILLLSVRDGYSSEEVGRALGLTAINVRVRLHRLLAGLRERYGETVGQQA